jgi:hypothetical protein
MIHLIFVEQGMQLANRQPVHPIIRTGGKNVTTGDIFLILPWKNTRLKFTPKRYIIIGKMNEGLDMNVKQGSNRRG